jgi:hypothetical protein
MVVGSCEIVALMAVFCDHKRVTFLEYYSQGETLSECGFANLSKKKVKNRIIYFRMREKFEEITELIRGCK